MKRYQLFPVLALATLAVPILATPSWSLDRTAPPRFNQQHRIAHGARDGSISGPEFMHLQRQRHHMRVARHRARTDGRLSVRKHRRLLNVRRPANRHVYRAKYHRARNGAYRGAPVRMLCRPPRPAPRRQQGIGFFHGAVMQPGWSVGWGINLD